MFDFQVFVREEHLSAGVAAWSNLENTAKETDCDQIYLDEDTHVPGYPGKILVFRASASQNSVQSRVKAVELILQRVAEETVKEKGNNYRRSERYDNMDHKDVKLETIIFVPEGLVSMVIGTRGRQIKYFKEKSGADVVVN
jgi:hypothetical protein